MPTTMATQRKAPMEARHQEMGVEDGMPLGEGEVEIGLGVVVMEVVRVSEGEEAGDGAAYDG